MSDALNNRQKSTAARGHVFLYAIALVLMLVFAMLAAGVITNSLTALDRSITSVVWALRTPTTTKIMKFITCLGNTSFTFSIALASALVFLKTKKDSWYITMTLVALIGSPVFNNLLKNIFARSRPGIDVLISAGGFSFPSGHAMIASAFYGMLAYWLWISLKSAPARYLAVFFFGLLILAIGLSRIYLGVHYPSDVLAGFAAGGSWLIVCISISEKMRVKM